jgi:uncharacterized protein (TIGR00369 family)
VSAPTFPDFWNVLGLEVVSTDAREIVVASRVPDWVVTPFATVHGGALAMIFDTVLAMAIVRQLERPEDRVATHQLSVSYASFTTERELRCHARVASLTRTVGVAEGELVERGGKLVAKALGTFGVRRTGA